MRTRLHRETAAVLCAIAIGGAQAAGPVVVESRTPAQIRVEPQVVRTAPVAERDATNGGELALRVQSMEAEVAQLRGIIEAQAHQIETLTSENRDRYLDLDRRLAVLSGSSATGTTTTGLPPGGESAGSEQQAYEAAFALTRERRHEEAIAAFRAVLVDHPAGTLTPNAFYWLGENYLALPEPQLEQARQAFAQVVNLFPDHGKVPDALYKLGVVHDRLGAPVRARDYLQQLINEHDGSAAARLATSYLAQMR